MMAYGVSSGYDDIVINLLIHLGNKIIVLPQYFIPQHLITGLVHRITRCETVWFKNFLIKQFIQLFKVDMTLAEEPKPENYAHFNAFFTRTLIATARPIQADKTKILCPVDGVISQVGEINDYAVIQAKGKSYSLHDLLTAKIFAGTFRHGSFATLYLAPKDYHRIHMPLTGQLVNMIYVPGKLFSVDPITVRTVNAVFTKNERVINIFNTDIGYLAIIMVGALNVSSMETVWSGEITPNQQRIIRHEQYAHDEVILQQGEEMGRFNMGSTVIVLFQKDVIRWGSELSVGDPVIMGQNIADVRQ